MWNPDVYLAFADHRGRPFFDLLSRVGATAPRRVVDLGCGPGNLTETLAQRWPGAVVEAWDSSPEMVDAARERGVDAHVGDVRAWNPRPDTDVVVSNATLQWVPEHAELLVRWVGQLEAGSWIAMQVPGNFDASSHRAVRELAGREQWSEPLRDFPFREGQVDDPSGYAALLSDTGCTVDAWETQRCASGAGVDHRYRAYPGEEPAHRSPVAAVPAGADPDAGRRLPGAFRR
jgi:trans-aconitate 2-methyltransferase